MEHTEGAKLLAAAPQLEVVSDAEEQWGAPPQPRAGMRFKAVAIAAAALLGAAALVSRASSGARAPVAAASIAPSGLIVADEEEGKEDKPVYKKCLCVFDIDRTLTGKQGWAGQCGKDLELAGVQDAAYAKGTMVASQLAQSMSKTFCGECYHGIVTAGVASGDGSPERKKLLEFLGGSARTRTDFWQDISFNPGTTVVSSLVVQAKDGNKQDSVASMVQWWHTKQGIKFEKEDVYFFDDMKENVQPFEGTGFNAQQVSCASRGPAEALPGAYDGKIGGCGGAIADIIKRQGVHICE